MIRVRVIGDPAPQGSKTAVRRDNKVIQLEGSSKTGRDKHRAWRGAVARAAHTQAVKHGLIDQPCGISIAFHMPRPKTVRRAFPSVKPDLDKLIRSTLDGLVDGKLLEDDALVIRVFADKRYADTEPPGAVLTIDRIDEQAGAA